MPLCSPLLERLNADKAVLSRMPTCPEYVHMPPRYLYMTSDQWQMEIVKHIQHNMTRFNDSHSFAFSWSFSLSSCRLIHQLLT